MDRWKKMGVCELIKEAVSKEDYARIISEIELHGNKDIEDMNLWSALESFVSRGGRRGMVVQHVPVTVRMKLGIDNPTIKDLGIYLEKYGYGEFKEMNGFGAISMDVLVKFVDNYEVLQGNSG